MKKNEYQIIISATNDKNELLFSKPYGTFDGSKKPFHYNNESEANKEIESLKELIGYAYNSLKITFEVKPI